MSHDELRALSISFCFFWVAFAGLEYWSVSTLVSNDTYQGLLGLITLVSFFIYRWLSD